MPQKLTVQAVRGRPDNLRESINIAFTVTPIKSGGSTYSPYARWVTSFPVDVSKSVSIEWDWELLFCTYTSSLSQYGNQHRGWTGTQMSPFLVPGQSIVMVGSPAWSGITSGQDPASVRMINRSGSAQNILLCGVSKNAIVSYDSPVEDGGSIIVPAGLEVQAYVVANQILEWEVLSPENLDRPIFPEALNCNDLPDSSVWRLCRDHNGGVRLRNDQGLESVSELKRQLNTMARLLSDFQQRPGAVEESSGRVRVLPLQHGQPTTGRYFKEFEAEMDNSVEFTLRTYARGANVQKLEALYHETMEKLVSKDQSPGRDHASEARVRGMKEMLAGGGGLEAVEQPLGSPSINFPPEPSR